MTILDSHQQELLSQMRRRHALTCLVLSVIPIIPGLFLNLQADQLFQASVRSVTLTLTILTTFRIYKRGVDTLGAYMGLTASGIGTLLALSVLGGLHAPMAVPVLISFVAFALACFGEDYRRIATAFAVVCFLVLAYIELTGQGALIEHRVVNDAKMRANQVIGLTLVFGATLLYGFLMMRWSDLKSRLIDDANIRLEAEARELAAVQNRKDALFSIVSHELRTPATTIHMLADQGDATEDNREHILKATAHLLNVIDDLRTTINIDESPQLRTVHFSLRELLSEVERQISGICSKQHIYFKQVITPDIPDVFYSDAYRIRSMLTNLIRNAAIHSQGTEIQLSVEALSTDANASSICFSVADNGIGIAEADVERIFEPFERGTQLTSGTGVGLHIVKNWSDVLGGTITYQPSALGGAEFALTLPLTHGEPGKLGPTETETRTLTDIAKGKNVLLVEDDAMIARISRQMLERQLQMVVVIASDGQEGLQAWKDGDFDLILTDYFMPNMDGCEFTKSVRETGSEVPIIGVTAATIGDERNDLREAGATAVLTKPLKLPELEEALATIFNRESTQ